jgi:hypothetical protein
VPSAPPPSQLPGEEYEQPTVVTPREEPTAGDPATEPAEPPPQPAEAPTDGNATAL